MTFLTTQNTTQKSNQKDDEMDSNNDEDNHETGCETCGETLKTLAQCKGGCKKYFCEKCILYWKIVKDECPFRCCKPWNISVPVLSDKSIEGEVPTDWDGFISCPRCARLGCLYCRNHSCRKRIAFNEFNIEGNATIRIPSCAHCPETPNLQLFGSVDHAHDQCTNEQLYYWHCPICRRKYCC